MYINQQDILGNLANSVITKGNYAQTRRRPEKVRVESVEYANDKTENKMKRNFSIMLLA